MSDTQSDALLEAASPGPEPVVVKKPTKVLPSDRLSLEKQTLALRGFGIAYQTNSSKAVTNEDVGKIIGMSGATVVVTNPFFVDLGLLQRRKDEDGFVPSQDVLNYCQAHEWSKETAAEKLRPVFERGWFSQQLLPRLKIRSLTQAEALAVLAEACNAGKEYEPRLERLLEMMGHVGVVQKDGNSIRSNLPSPALDQDQVKTPAVQPANVQREPETDGLEEYVLPLDPKKKDRKVVVRAPATITKKELDRLKSWLDFQLIVEESQP